MHTFRPNRVALAACLGLALSGTGAEARFRCRVTNTNDGGNGSLRNCLEEAADAGDTEQYTIVFAKDLAGEVIVNESDVDYPQVVGPDLLVIRGPRGGGVEIDALEPSVEDPSRLPVVFWTGANVDLDISRVTVRGGFECVRMSETLSGGEPGDTRDVDLTLTDFHCSEASGSGVFVNENIGVFHIRSSSFDNNGSNGISIFPATSGDVEEDFYDISLTSVECNDNARWGTFIDVISAPVGGTLSITRYVGNGNGEYGLEAIDAGEGRLQVPVVQFSTFNGNNEGLEFVNAHIDVIRACEIDDNNEYGLGLEQSSLTLLKKSLIVNNGEFGIDLEALASIEAIEGTKIAGNELGVIKCGPDNLRSARGADAGKPPAN